MINISMDVMTVTMNMMKFFNEKRPPGNRNAEAGKSIGLPRTISNINQKMHFNELLADNIPEKDNKGTIKINYIAPQELTEEDLVWMTAGVVPTKTVTKKELKKIYPDRINRKVFHRVEISAAPHKGHFRKVEI